MIKKIFPLIIILLLLPEIPAQTSSSFSRYGIGNIEYSYSARKLGMGQLGTAVSDVDFINSINPAGWNKIDRTRIEFGFNYSGMTLTSQSESKFYSDTEFSGFTLAFPVSTDFGATLAAGIIPYSNVSYNVVENYTTTTAGDYSISYTGSGGLSKIFFGSSFKFPFNVSIGATLDYYFGNLNYKSRVEFSGNENRPAEYIRTFSPKGIGTTVGIISPDLSNVIGAGGISNVRLGVSANIFSTLSTDTVLTSHRDVSIDTIAFGLVDTDIPPRVHAGLSFVLDEEYLVTLDYAFQQWEKYLFNNISSSQLRNSSRFSGGFEYRPGREIGSSFWEQIIFRGGLTYEQTQYTFNGTGINFYAASAGLSLPLSTGNTLDLGLQYGIRGTEDLIKENIIRLNVGISLGDIWFIRQEK